MWYPATAAQPKRRPWALFLPLLIPVVVLAGFAAYVLLTPSKPRPLVPPPGHHGALVWGDGIFASTPEMRAWLQQHGGRYPSWASRHPRGVSLITSPRKEHSARSKHVKRASR